MYFSSFHTTFSVDSIPTGLVVDPTTTADRLLYLTEYMWEDNLDNGVEVYNDNSTIVQALIKGGNVSGIDVGLIPGRYLVNQDPNAVDLKLTKSGPSGPVFQGSTFS